MGHGNPRRGVCAGAHGHAKPGAREGCHVACDTCATCIAPHGLCIALSVLRLRWYTRCTSTSAACGVCLLRAGVWAAPLVLTLPTAKRHHAAPPPRPYLYTALPPPCPQKGMPPRTRSSSPSPPSPPPPQASDTVTLRATTRGATSSDNGTHYPTLRFAKTAAFPSVLLVPHHDFYLLRYDTTVLNATSDLNAKLPWSRREPAVYGRYNMWVLGSTAKGGSASRLARHELGGPRCAAWAQGHPSSAPSQAPVAPLATPTSRSAIWFQLLQSKTLSWSLPAAPGCPHDLPGTFHGTATLPTPPRCGWAQGTWPYAAGCGARPAWCAATSWAPC